MKKAIVILVVVAMLGSLLTGCSGNSSGNGNKTGETQEATSTQTAAEDTSEEPTAAAEEHEECEITYFTWSQSSDGSYPQNMVDAFEAKYPWIKVNFEMGSQTEEEYSQAQKVKFLAEDGIDVTTIYPSIYKDFIEAGYLEDLTGAEYLSNYTDSTLAQVTVNDKIYGIPFAKDAVGVMYNKDMFAKNGWQVPTCQEEWLALCDTVAAAGVTPMINGAKDAWPLAHEIMPFIHQLYVNNQDIFEKINSKEAKYTDQLFVDCFTKIQNYFNSSAVSKDAIGLTYDQAASYFATGKAAMMCHGEWAMDSISAAEPDFEIGVFQVPANAKGEAQIGTAEVGQFQAIASCSKNKEAAQLFVEFMSSKEGAQYFADAMGNFTAVEGVEAPGKEQWTEIMDAESIPFYYDQMYSGASAELFKQLQLLYIGDTTVEEALQSMQNAQDKSE